MIQRYGKIFHALGLEESMLLKWPYYAKHFQMYKLDLEKPEEPEIKLPTSVVS